MALDHEGHTRSTTQASNGHVDPRLAALTQEDQQLVWAGATLMLDTTHHYGVDVAKFTMEKLPNLPRDEEMVKALEDHAEADAREVLVTLRSGMDPTAHETPVEAISHARYLHHRGVGLQTLLTVYQLGFAMFREMVNFQLREAASDEAQFRRLAAAVDAYSFPFVAKATQRLAYEFGSDDGWTPTESDPALSDPDSLERASQLREQQVAKGDWIADSVDEASASREAERLLREFSETLQSGVHDKGLHDRLALAATTVAITLADEDEMSISLLLDRSPIEVVDGAADTESQLWIPSVDLIRLWSPDFYLPMAIAKGRVRIRGPIRRFLRIVPILRTVGEAPAVASPDSH